MKTIQSSNCDACGQEESNIHFVYTCPSKNDLIIWLKNILKKYCDVDNFNLLKLLLLETPRLAQKVKNTCISLVATYIVCMWNVKNKNMDTNTRMKYLKGEIITKHRYIAYALEDKLSEKVTQQYWELDRIDL